jgi:hypothetical protein
MSVANVVTQKNRLPNPLRLQQATSSEPAAYVLSAWARPLAEAPVLVRSGATVVIGAAQEGAIYKLYEVLERSAGVRGQDAYLCRSSIGAGERRHVPVQRPSPVSTCVAVEGHVDHMKIHAQDRPTGAARVGSLPTFFRS